jgi:uncharacterized membrane protein YdbT with pleckstrin-like domain
MSYIDKSLTVGESVLYRTRLHWISIFWNVVFAALFGLVGLLLIVVALSDMKSAGDALWIGLFCIVVAATLGFLGKLRRNSVEMAVTNKRVIIKVGLISKRTIELFLAKVESIGVNQGILGRVLGYGSVVVRGTGGTAEPFKYVERPEDFRRQVQHHMEMATR